MAAQWAAWLWWLAAQNEEAEQLMLLAKTSDLSRRIWRIVSLEDRKIVTKKQRKSRRTRRQEAPNDDDDDAEKEQKGLLGKLKETSMDAHFVSGPTVVGCVWYVPSSF